MAVIEPAAVPPEPPLRARALLRRMLTRTSAILALALAIFGGVFALRLAVSGPGEVVGVLFVVPIALLAIAFGPVGGLAAAALALGLIALWVEVRGVELRALGWAARAVVFALVGGSLGVYAARLRAAETRQRRLVHDAPDAVLDLDPDGRIVALNPEAERLLAARAAVLRGRSVAELVHDRTPRAREAVLRCLAAPEFRSIEGLALVRDDGVELGADVTLMPRSTAGGAVVRAVVRDVSERRRSHEALRHTAALLTAAEQAGEMGSWEWDVPTGRHWWSDGMYRLLGHEPQAVDAGFEALLAAVHPGDRDALAAAARRAVEDGEAPRLEFRVLRPDGETRVLESRGRAVGDAAGRTATIIGTTRDVTERVRSERALEHAAAQRARAEQTQRLLQITDAALASLPLEELLARLLRRVCDALPADGASLLLTDPATGSLRLRAIRGIAAAAPPAATGGGLVPRVAAARRALGVAGPDLEPASPVGALAAAPLLVGDDVIGVLRVGRRAAVPLTEAELALLQLAADRTALAIDHGRIFERERHIARTLQESLLPQQLPEIPGVELQARFLPAGEGQEVGGDFYDAFALPGRRWLLVLGDVCGKGPQAAALTALVRYTLRAEAMHEPRPGELLGLLNDAILAQRSDLRFSTGVCLRLDAAGDGWEVTLAAGGHPMPLIVRAAGAVEVPPASLGGPLVGVLPGAEFPERTYRLRRGDTLVAYTDGLLDAHAPERVLSPDDLAEAAGRLPARPLDGFLRGLEDAALGRRPAPVRDDIAILALGVTGAAR